MSAKRVLLVVLVASAVMLAVGGGAARARFSESAAASVTAAPHLGGEITISALDNEDYLPSVAYNWKHREYLVVWHNTWDIGTRDIRAQRVSAGGQLLGSEFIVAESFTKDYAQPSVDYDPVNDRYLVAYIYDTVGDGSDWDLYGRFIPWDGPSASLTEFAICTWTTHQWTPKVAYGRAVEEYLVVWNNEYQSGVLPMYISGRRVKAADGSFPGSDSDLTISHATENRVNPDVTYNLARNEYLVVYDNVVDIFGIRLTGDLSHNFGGEFGIAGWPDTEQHPAVAACDDADQYLVVWQSSAGNYDIYARFVKGDGTVDSVHHLRGTTVAEVEPDVTCNMSGQQYLVVWQQQYSNLSGPHGVWGQLVFSDKTMGSAFGIVGGVTGADRTEPAVAGGYTNYLAVWEHDRSGTSFQDIHGRLVTPYAVFLPLVVRNF